MYPLLKDHDNQRVGLRFFEASDHITPKTDVNPGTATVTVAKAGGSLQASSAVLSAHEGGGFYWLTLPASDVDTIGQLVIRVEAAGADDAFVQVWVRAVTEQDLAIRMEYQRGIYGALPVAFYWDPINGDDAGDGRTIASAKKTFASAYNLVEANRHDTVIILPGQIGGLTVITETVNLNKEHSYLRGPGRDVAFIPITDGVPTVLLSALGAAISGMLVNTASSGNDDAVKINQDYCGLDHVWSDMAGGNGVNISGAGHCRMNDVYVEGAGASGAGSGLLIDGMSLNAEKNFIRNCAFMASFDQGTIIKGPNATGNYFYQTAFLGNGKYGVKEENTPDLNIVRDCSFAGNGSGDYLIEGAASKVENPGDIATAAAEKVWNKDVDDNTFSTGKMGFWFYKLKQYFLNRKDAGITTSGEETFYKDDNVTIAMSGAMKKSSGASWNPPTEGVAQRERMS